MSPDNFSCCEFKRQVQFDLENGTQIKQSTPELNDAYGIAIEIYQLAQETKENVHEKIRYFSIKIGHVDHNGIRSCLVSVLQEALSGSENCESVNNKIPEVITCITPGNAVVNIFGETGVRRSVLVTDDFIKEQEIMGRYRYLHESRRILEKELGAPLKKFINNKWLRKAFYAVLCSLQLKHKDSIKETAFYLREAGEWNIVA